MSVGHVEKVLLRKGFSMSQVICSAGGRVGPETFQYSTTASEVILLVPNTDVKKRATSWPSNQRLGMCSAHCSQQCGESCGGRD